VSAMAFGENYVCVCVRVLAHVNRWVWDNSSGVSGPAPYDLTEVDDFYPGLCSLRPPPQGRGDWRQHLHW
jgi:hypothetical protein